MSEIDQINDDILNSLNSFTKRIQEASSDQFNKIRSCSFFDPIPSQYLAEVASKSHISSFTQGQKIATEHDIVRHFYVIIFGSASVQVDNHSVGRILSGECLGESAFFTQEAPARSATVIAEGEVIAVEMSHADIASISDETRVFLDKALLLALFKKLQTANKHIISHP
jgi:CRP-like cAMP-binding protein